MYKTEMTVSGLYCGHCIMQLNGALSEIGAREIEIDQYTGKTSFVTDHEPDISAVVKAVGKYGFEAHGLLCEKL